MPWNPPQSTDLECDYILVGTLGVLGKFVGSNNFTEKNPLFDHEARPSGLERGIYVRALQLL